jgi:hypothetical protein
MLFALSACDQKDGATPDETDLAFAGPADPKGFQAPPTISIKDQGALATRTLDYNTTLRCSAAIGFLQDQLAKTGRLDARQTRILAQTVSLTSRRLATTAASEGKSPSDVSAELARAAQNAAERPEESMREAVSCIQRLAVAG